VGALSDEGAGAAPEGIRLVPFPEGRDEQLGQDEEEQQPEGHKGVVVGQDKVLGEGVPPHDVLEPGVEGGGQGALIEEGADAIAGVGVRSQAVVLLAVGVQPEVLCLLMCVVCVASVEGAALAPAGPRHRGEPKQIEGHKKKDW